MLSECKEHFENKEGLFVKCSSVDDLAKILVFFKSSRQSVVYLFGASSNLLLQWVTETFKFIEAAGGLVINEFGQILLIERNGVWDLPKGKVELGEQTNQAALREVEEECGVKNLSIENKITDTYHTYDLENETVIKKTHWYLMRYSGNDKLTPQREEGITQVLWVNLDDIRIYLQSTFPSIVDVFSVMGML